MLTFHSANTFLLTDEGFKQCKDIIRSNNKIALYHEGIIYYDKVKSFSEADFSAYKIIDSSFVEETRLSYIGYKDNLLLLDSNELIYLSDLNNQSLKRYTNTNLAKSKLIKSKQRLININTINEVGYFISTNKIGNYLFVKQICK